MNRRCSRLLRSQITIIDRQRAEDDQRDEPERDEQPEPLRAGRLGKRRLRGSGHAVRLGLLRRCGRRLLLGGLLRRRQRRRPVELLGQPVVDVPLALVVLHDLGVRGHRGVAGPRLREDEDLEADRVRVRVLHVAPAPRAPCRQPGTGRRACRPCPTASRSSPSRRSGPARSQAFPGSSRATAWRMNSREDGVDGLLLSRREGRALRLHVVRDHGPVRVPRVARGREVQRQETRSEWPGPGRTSGDPLAPPG